MGSFANGIGCGVVQWVKRSTLRWFGYVERMRRDEFVKKVYVSGLGGSGIRGRPLGRWKDWVREYMCEMGVSKGKTLQQAKRVFG